MLYLLDTDVMITVIATVIWRRIALVLVAIPVQ
jgi:hypothetical protein